MSISEADHPDPEPNGRDEKHIRGASDSASRINDALSILLSAFGINKHRRALIQAIDGVSGGRLTRFSSFLISIARRLDTPPSEKQVQRDIKYLLDEQRALGLEISCEKSKKRVCIEGHVLSYWSARGEGIPGEFQLNIKSHALEVYKRAKCAPDYRKHKSRTIEQVAAEYASELLYKANNPERAELVHLVFDKPQKGGKEKPALQEADIEMKEIERAGEYSLACAHMRAAHTTKAELIAGKLVENATWEIRSHVETQIEGFLSVGVQRFSLRIIDIWGKSHEDKRAVQSWKDLTPERMVELAPLVVQRCRDMVEKQGKGWNAILTPYPSAGIQLLQADDIDEYAVEEYSDLTFQVYRTSDGDGQGNYQAWIAVQSEDRTLAHRFKRAIGSDMGASLSVRVAGSYNAKPWRQRADGSYPIVTLYDDNLGLTVQEADLRCLKLNVEIEKDQKQNLHNTAIKKTIPLPEYSYFLKRAELRKDGSGDDISRVDYNYVRCIADRGFPMAIALRELAKNSNIERPNKEEYFSRTVRAAYEELQQTRFKQPVIADSSSPDRELILAEQRLERMRAERRMEELAQEKERHIDRMPGGMHCNKCKAPISVGQSICERCEAEEMAMDSAIRSQRKA